MFFAFVCAPELDASPTIYPICTQYLEPTLSLFSGCRVPPESRLTEPVNTVKGVPCEQAGILKHPTATNTYVWGRDWIRVGPVGARRAGARTGAAAARPHALDECEGDNEHIKQDAELCSTVAVSIAHRLYMV